MERRGLRRRNRGLLDRPICLRRRDLLGAAIRLLALGRDGLHQDLVRRRRGAFLGRGLLHRFVVATGLHRDNRRRQRRLRCTDLLRLHRQGRDARLGRYRPTLSAGRIRRCLRGRGAAGVDGRKRFGHDGIVDLAVRAGLLELAEIDRIGAHLARLLIHQRDQILVRRHGAVEPQGAQRAEALPGRPVERAGRAIGFLGRDTLRDHARDEDLARRQHQNLRLRATRASHEQRQAGKNEPARSSQHRQGIPARLGLSQVCPPMRLRLRATSASGGASRFADVFV